MIGNTVSHYRITALLGQGGMGRVYRAVDVRLDREVALKLLPAEFTQDTERVRRFVQEAKAASALNHPNIVTVYDVGDSDAGRFIAMELVKGRTLRELMKTDKSAEMLPKLARQMAAALSAAHAAGIAHRDIKPDNIMVREDGYVKILDFGLARLVPMSAGSDEAETLAQQTAFGRILGTVAYMSPEQAGGKVVSPASDIFSLGIVLYEMATGRHPFKADTPVAYLHAITLQGAAPLTEMKPGLPEALNDLLMRMLAKEPDRRPTALEAAQVLEEIERYASTTERRGESRAAAPPGQQPLETGQPPGSPATRVGPGKRWTVLAAAVFLAAVTGLGYWLFSPRDSTEAIDSLAVLPFGNDSANPDSEYLADGLAESLIFRLSQLPNLKVSPTSSVSRYKGRDVDPIRIGGELGVRAVMTGRVSQRDERLVVSVELVDVSGHQTLWGEHYDRKLADVLNLQREMAAQITQRLKLELSGESRKKLAKDYTSYSEAYQLYLKGQYHFSRRTRLDQQKSIEFFRQAIALDPSFALAYAALAESYATMPLYPYLSPSEAASPARAAISKALELDPELAQAHAIAGYVSSLFDWDWAAAETHFKRAIELDPNLANAHYRYAFTFLSPLGRHAEAIAEMKRAMELEPLNLIQGAHSAAIYFYARDFDAALQKARETHDLDPAFVIGTAWLGFCLNANGKYEETLALLEPNPRDDYLLFPQISYAYAKLDRREQARQVLGEWNENEEIPYVLNYWRAATYAVLGDREEAFKELEKAYQARDLLFQRLKVDPLMDPLRDDPRFADLVERLNLPE